MTFITVYYVNIHQWNDLNDAAYISHHRQQSIQKYRNFADKVRCLGSGLLLRYVFGDIALSAPLFGEYGKPFFANMPCFSLTHSGDYVALAIINAESVSKSMPCPDIGLDIEKKENTEDSLFQTIERCFTVQEQKWFKKQNNLSQAFYTLWTAKESVMKATGYGFSLDPMTINLINAHGQLAHSYIFQEKQWYFSWHNLSNHILCFCSNSKVEIQYSCLSRNEILRHC